MLPPSAAAGTAVTLRDAMARLRDHLIAEHQRTRAAHLADPARAAPQSEAIAFPPDLVEGLVAFAERRSAAEGDELPEGLSARACEALAGWRWKGASLPGLYPPNAENKARYEASRGKR